MEPPITDPTLAAFYEPTTEPECIYFAAYYTETGDLRMTRVVRPVTDNPAPWKVDIPAPEKEDQNHAA